MKNLQFLLVLLVSTSLAAINPAEEAMLNHFSTSSNAIDMELNDLHQMNTLVIENSYDYNALSANHAALVETANLSSKTSAGIFEGHPDNPIGIPGFWWGFCLGWVGLLVVYLTMDEGSARKEQVKNALWGCIISSVVVGVFYFLLIIAAAST